MDRPGNTSDIPEIQLLDEAHVGAGSLQVTGSSEIVDIINDWKKKFEKSASVATTQDWHPEDHCSFCRFSKGGSTRMVAAYKPEPQAQADITLGKTPAEIAAASYGVCLTGGNANTFLDTWATTRCLDETSKQDYLNHKLYTWPDHCVKNTFGSQFDPWLDVTNTTNFKIGFEKMYVANIFYFLCHHVWVWVQVGGLLTLSPHMHS